MNAAAAENIEGEVDTIIFIGDELSAAREARSMSVEDVARRLNLDVQVVQDLEQNNYDSLPERAYIRGYLLAYVRLMELPVSLLDSFDVANISTGPLLTTGYSVQASCSRDGWVRCVSTGLIVLLVIALGVWVLEQSYDGFGTADIFVSPDDGETSAKQDIIASVPVLTIEGESNQSEVADVLAPEVVSSDVVKQNNGTAIEIEADAMPITNVDAPASQEPLLTVKFLGDSWIRIDDAKGSKLRTGNYEQGQEIKLSHKGEIHLIIGRTRNVELDYGGKIIDLSGYKAGRVARLVLGKSAE